MVLYTRSFSLFHKLTSFTFSPPALHGPCHMKIAPSVLTARFQSVISPCINLLLLSFSWSVVSKDTQILTLLCPITAATLVQAKSWQSRTSAILLKKGSWIMLFLNSGPSSDWMMHSEWKLESFPRVCKTRQICLRPGHSDLLWAFSPCFLCFRRTDVLAVSQTLQGWSHLRVYICCSLCLKCSSSKPQSSLPHIFPVLPKYNPLSGVFPGQPF